VQALLRPADLVLQLSAFGDVKEGDDGADHLPVAANRVRPVPGGETGPVRAPESFLVDMKDLVLPKRPEDSALFLRIRRPVFAGTMEQAVHIPAQKLARGRVAQESGARRVGEGAAALQVDLINRLGGRIEPEPEVIFTLSESFVSSVSFDSQGDIASIRANETDRVERPPRTHSDPDASQPNQRHGDHRMRVRRIAGLGAPEAQPDRPAASRASAPFAALSLVK
jgi:hypothetical protein